MLTTDQVPAVIGGRNVATDTAIIVLDPSTGEPLAQVARCGPADVDAAVVAARRAFERTWRRYPAVERGRLLRSLADLVRRDAAELATLESSDTGKPLAQAQADVRTTAEYFEFYADVVRALHGDVIPPGQPDTLVLATREPLGVTAHIIPWNYPMAMMGRTVAPALAAGNCSVVKPAEDAPLTPLRLAGLAREAGLPDGVLNVVPGLGEEAGAALTAHAGIDHVSFTGSTEVGTLVAKAAADHAAGVTLELGGKSPQIVFADADLELAVPAVVGSILQNAGQTCSAGSRLLVERRVCADVVEAVRERFASASVGPGRTDPDLGPLISELQRDTVARAVAAAVGAGEARVVTGGDRPADPHLADGFYYRPTLLDQVQPDSLVAHEEIFGPVLTVVPFDRTEDAVRIAEGTPYGLVAGVWTREVDRAIGLAAELRAGCVYVNTFGGGVEVPFGGYKRSGHGREKGFEALRGYTQTKSVVIRSRPLGQP